MSGKRKRAKLPKLRQAISSSDVPQASGSRATSTLPSRQVHITAPVNLSKAPGYSTSYIHARESSSAPSSAPTSDVASEHDDADDEGDIPTSSSTSVVYYIQEGDARDAAKRLRTSKRLRRVRDILSLFFLSHFLRPNLPGSRELNILGILGRPSPGIPQRTRHVLGRAITT